MAKKSKIAKNEQRRAIVARHAGRRRELKEAIRLGTGGPEGVAEAVRALSRLPRDASPTRLRNRCSTDGRPRGYVGKAGVSRVRFRAFAHDGRLPGIVKSSW